MASKVLNIEIGKHIVKVCVTVKSGKSYRITENFVFSTPENTVSDGQITDALTLGKRLRDELSRHMANTSAAVFALTSSKIAVREVSLPPVKDEQIKSIVASNAADYFPIDTAQYGISSVVLERDKTGCRVMVVAVPSVMISSYIDLAEAAGLSVTALDFSGNAQYQVLRSLNHETVDMFVTVDAEATTVLFMENGTLLMQRSLSVGGNEAVSCYLEQKGLTDDDHFAALSALSEPCEEAAGVQDCIRRLNSNINRSIDFFRSGKFADKTIDRVILTGSCGKLYGLQQGIGDFAQAPCFGLESISEAQTLANSVQSISLYVTCLGARIAPMDLLPREYMGRGGRKDSALTQNLGLIVGGLCVVVSLALVLSGFITNQLSKSKLKKLEEEISSLAYVEETYSIYVSYKAGDEKLQAYIDAAATPNKKLYDFLSEMEKKMPSDISLLSADCTADGVNMVVNVTSFASASAVIRQLRCFQSVDVISVGTIESSESESGASSVSFTLGCRYAQPEEETTQQATEQTTAAKN